MDGELDWCGAGDEVEYDKGFADRRPVIMTEDDHFLVGLVTQQL